MKKIFIILLFACNLFAQSYSDYSGTVIDSFRIGNDRHFSFKLDNDSSFIDLNITGLRKRIATQDWVKSYSGKSGIRSINGMRDSIQFITIDTLNTDFTFSTDTASKTHKFSFPFASATKAGKLKSSDWTKFNNKQNALVFKTPLLKSADSVWIMYETNNFTNTSNKLTAKNITASSTNGVSITSSFTLGDAIIVNTAQDIRSPAAPTFGGATLNGTLNQNGNIVLDSLKSISSKYFLSGWAGSGFKLDYSVSDLGKTKLEIDNLTVRKTMSIYELLIRQIQATNGNLFVTSSAKAKAAGVSYITFEDPTGHNVIPFAAGDLIVAQRLKLNGDLSSKLIYAEFTVSSITGMTVYGSWNTAPAGSNYSLVIGVDFVRVGSTSDVNRRGSIYLAADDNNAPFIDIINDVSSWTAWASASKTKVRLGKLNGVVDADFGGALSGYGVYIQNAYVKGDIQMTSGSISWASVAKPTYVASEVGARASDWLPTKSELGTWTTYIDANGIYTGTLTANQVNAVAITADSISVNAIGKIAGWTMNSTALYKTQTELDTKIIMNLYGTMANHALGLQIVTQDLTESPGYENKLITSVGSYNDGGYSRYGLSIWDAANGAFLVNIGHSIYTNTTIANIAGWSFDKEKFYNYSSATGFELSNAATKNITTGFAVWHPSNPKMFIGNSTNYLDWNNTAANTLTIKGTLIGSSIKAGSILAADYQAGWTHRNRTVIGDSINNSFPIVFWNRHTSASDSSQYGYVSISNNPIANTGSYPGSLSYNSDFRIFGSKQPSGQYSTSTLRVTLIDQANGEFMQFRPDGVYIKTSSTLTKIIGVQGGAVADCTVGNLSDTGTKLNLLLARLRAHGIIAN